MDLVDPPQIVKSLELLVPQLGVAHFLAQSSSKESSLVGVVGVVLRKVFELFKLYVRDSLLLQRFVLLFTLLGEAFFNKVLLTKSSLGFDLPLPFFKFLL